MTERRVITKTELITDIDQKWTALNAALDQLTAAQMTVPKDAQGWSVKDHLIHLLYWERSVIFFFQGQPRYAGLEVEEALFLKGDFDAINAAIFQQHKDQPLNETLTQLRSTHQQLMKLVQPLTDDDLQKPYRHYLPLEPGEGDGPPAMKVVYNNTAGHFRDHLTWIETLVKGTSV